MPKAINITSMRFGMLVAIRRSHVANNRIHWLCQCDCGQFSKPTVGALRSGNCTSCGCRERRRSGPDDRRAVDITNQRFSKLVVIERAGTAATRHSLWLCRCDCGNNHIVKLQKLRSGEVKSCGCAWHDGKHGYARTVGRPRHYLYNLWSAMRTRCNNPKSERYEDYGGRGIKVYERWDKSFPDFLADILTEIGERPSPEHSLDRYPDNDSGYQPGNIRWATAKEQAINTRPRRVRSRS